MVQHKRQQQQEQGIKPWHAQLALLLLLVATSIPQAAAIRLRLPPSRHLLVLGQLGAHADSVAYVAKASAKADAGITRPTVTLLEALKDPEVTHMILLTNYTVGKEFEHFAEGDTPPLHLSRNVTIEAQPGAMPLLDFQFMRSVVHLCPTCTLLMRNIAVANERRGNGAMVDFFVGVPGSMLILKDSYRLRLACTSSDSTEELIHREQPRSKRFRLPGDVEQRQLLQRDNGTYHGHDYTDMVKLIDFAYDVPATFQEGKGLVGGFTMRTINTTRLCWTTVSQACLKVKGPDVCVNEAIDELLRGTAPYDPSHTAQQAASQRHPNSGWVVAVAVTISVVAALLLGASGVAWVMCARHRKQRKHQELCGKSAALASDSATGGGSRSLLGGPESGGGSSRDHENEEGGADPFFVNDLGGPSSDQGWEVAAVSTSPSLGAVGSAKIHFGRLLGAGSFGRVYKGRWAGREVAIKCIEHDSETSKAVENEVQLMLAMDHPNIVKALHYITYRHTLKLNSSTPEPSIRTSQPDSAAPSPDSVGALSGASRSRQQREQQKQLHQLERQLQTELGPKHQWLLDMHLGFVGQRSGSDPSSSQSCLPRNHISSSSNSVSSISSGPQATAVIDSPAVVSSALSPAQMSWQTTSADLDLSGTLQRLESIEDSNSSPAAAASTLMTFGGNCYSPVASSLAEDAAACQKASAVRCAVAGNTASAAAAACPNSRPDGQAILQQQQQQLACQVLLPAPGDHQQHADQQPLQQQQQPLSSTQDLYQQQQPVSANQHQQEQQQPQFWNADHLQQQQQQQQEQLLLLQTSDRGWTSHPSSLHSSLGRTGGSGDDFPASGQPLTPNQKIQLQRYLLRQQHLLQTSGMRVRSGAVAPPMPTGGNGAQGASGSDSGSEGGCLGDAAENSRTARRPHELQRSRTYIVQEYCDLGTLTSYASKTLTDPSDEEQLMQMLVLLQDAARGIAALHSKSVVHGDVNARNVLVSSCSTAPYGAVAKLADLGLSRCIRQHATHKTTNTVGTLSHMPPELLRHGRMSAAVDIYSFGIMMWEVFTAQPAFRHLHYGQFFECIVLKNMRPNVPEDMPRGYSLLMLSCWATNPTDRPTADRLLECLQMMLQERQELPDELYFQQTPQPPYTQQQQYGSQQQQYSSQQQYNQQQYNQQQYTQQQRSWAAAGGEGGRGLGEGVYGSRGSGGRGSGGAASLSTRSSSEESSSHLHG